MSKPFNVYQAINAACKRYNFTGEDKNELKKRILTDKPHDKADNKYRAVMGYAKQLAKELTSRQNGIAILHDEAAEVVLDRMNMPAERLRKEREKDSLTSMSIKVAAIMEEL